MGSASPKTPRALLRTSVAALVWLAAAPTALAQTAPEPSQAALAARRALVERAQAAGRGGDHAQALALAEAAGRVEMSASLRLFIAQEQATLGRHAAAMESAEVCVRESAHAAVERREVIAAECRRVLSVSQTRVVLLTVEPPAAPCEGISVRTGQRILTAGEYGVPLPVDPGAIVVEVTAPGVEPQRETLLGVAGAMLRVQVVPRFAASPRSPPPRATPPPTAPVALRPPARRPPSALARAGVAPWILAGTAGVSFVAAGVFWALRSAALQEARCAPAGAMIQCDDATAAAAFARGEGADPYTPTTLTQVAIGLGAAALVAGVTVLVLNVTQGAPRRAQLGPGALLVRF